MKETSCCRRVVGVERREEGEIWLTCHLAADERRLLLPDSLCSVVDPLAEMPES